MTKISDDDLHDYQQEAEHSRDEPLSPNATRPGQQRAKVLSVRLTADEFDALTQFANTLEIPASALVRGWILNHLPGSDANSSESPIKTVERIAHELDQLRRQLAA
jgi:hypothetical protein